jgi:2-oxoisovalerate dehydrogenase E1 component alpha subunit
MVEAVTPLRRYHSDQAMLRFVDPTGKFVRDDIPDIPARELLALYRHMVRIRVLEDRMVKLQRQGRIGFYIGTHGEEATHVGATYALRDTDLIFPAYREVGPALLRGFPLQTFIDQLFGNEDDLCQGRQMPNHHSGKAYHLASISSPVGTQIPQCAGSAWAAKLRGIDEVSLCFFGDGTTSEGDFHVGLNFAAVYKVPAIFLLRNNGWAISERATNQSATDTFHIKAKAYGMVGIRVDGNDIFAVVHAVREAAQRARNGEGPTLIEAVTYRLGPHSTSDDPSKYRPDGEYELNEKAEPLIRLRFILKSMGIFDVEAEEKVAKSYEDEIIAAVRIAEKKNPPLLRTMFEDVFADMTPALRQQQKYATDLENG